MSMSTPWGMSQGSEKIAVGIMSYTTASHGGVHLSKKRNALVPDYMRSDDAWYEEDDSWAIPAVVFPKEFDDYYQNAKSYGTDIVTIAKSTLMSYYPDQYEKFYNVKLVEGQSHDRDKQIAKERNKNNYVVISAIAIDDNTVKCFATLGGDIKTIGKYFKIPLEAYRNNRNNFVIDLDNHLEVTE